MELNKENFSNTADDISQNLKEIFMAHSNTIIRAATLGDLPALVALFTQYRGFYAKAANDERTQQFLSAHLQNATSQIFVAEIKNQLVGLVQLYPSWSSLEMGRMWQINDLFVQQDYRAFGIGKLLMQQAIAFAKEKHAVYIGIETAKDNIVAQNLYQQLGFEIDHNNIHLYLSC